MRQSQPAAGESISILVPVYNERSTVDQAIREILAAELPVDLNEVIVVDDGSTDGTSQVLAESRPRS